MLKWLVFPEPLQKRRDWSGGVELSWLQLWEVVQHLQYGTLSTLLLISTTVDI